MDYKFMSSEAKKYLIILSFQLSFKRSFFFEKV